MEMLTDLCEDLQIDPNLQKNESGFYLLPLNDSLQISVKSLDPGVFFFSPISPCPEAKREELFILLMKANLFGQGTFGSAIGLEPNQDHLTLSKAMPYEMDYRSFREEVEDFSNIVEYWRVEVKRHVEQGGIL